MVGNDSSFSAPVSRRKLSSAATASISLSFPLGASRSNQQRKFATAAPSRACADRVPAISVAFFCAFISVIGSAPRASVPPASAMARESASAAVAESSRTVAFAAPSAASASANAPGSRTSASVSR